MRDRWTDERLDDLNRHVSEGFNRVDKDLRSVRDEIGALRGAANGGLESLRSETNAGFESLRSEMSARFEYMDSRFDALQRLIFQVAGGMIATFVVGFASLLVAQA